MMRWCVGTLALLVGLTLAPPVASAGDGDLSIDDLPTVDDSIDEASADVTAVLTDGRRVRVFVEHAIGSLARPMSDAQLETKFHGMADPVLGAERCSALIQACWGLGPKPWFASTRTFCSDSGSQSCRRQLRSRSATSWSTCPTVPACR